MSDFTNKLYFGDNLDKRPRTPADRGRCALMFKEAQVEKKDKWQKLDF